MLCSNSQEALELEAKFKRYMKGIPCLKTSLVSSARPLACQMHRIKQGVKVIVAVPSKFISLYKRFYSSHGLFTQVSFVWLSELNKLLFSSGKSKILRVLQIIEQNFTYHKFLNRKAIESIIVSCESKSAELFLMQLCPQIREIQLEEKLAKPMHQKFKWVIQTQKKKKLISLIIDNTKYQQVFLDITETSLKTSIKKELRKKGVSSRVHCSVKTSGCSFEDLDLYVFVDFPDTLDKYFFTLNKMPENSTVLSFICQAQKRLFPALLELGQVPIPSIYLN